MRYSEENYSVSTSLCFVGVSAGVDQALSLVSVKTTMDELEKFDSHSFTAVAGAYHPTLYEICFDTFIADDTYVIVLHHTTDRFCAWRDVKPLWSELGTKCIQHQSSCIHRVL